MYYEINVSKLRKNGQYVHYFATAERSLTEKQEAIKALHDFRKRFPKPEFKITFSRWEKQGNGYNDIEKYLTENDPVYKEFKDNVLKHVKEYYMHQPDSRKIIFRTEPFPKNHLTCQRETNYEICTYTDFVEIYLKYYQRI